MNSILIKLNQRTTSLQDRTKKIREDLRAQAASLKERKDDIKKENFVENELTIGLGDVEIEAFKNRMNIGFKYRSIKY